MHVEGAENPPTTCRKSTQEANLAAESVSGPKAAQYRGLLAAFGVASPKACSDILARGRELAWLLAWMAEYHRRRDASADKGGTKRLSKDQMVGQFVIQVRDHDAPPPESALNLARSHLEGKDEFDAENLQALLEGVSRAAFLDKW